MKMKMGITGMENEWQAAGKWIKGKQSTNGE
jgi:hypothetical protein